MHLYVVILDCNVVEILVYIMSKIRHIILKKSLFINF